jgi:hypothetical protein
VKLKGILTVSLVLFLALSLAGMQFRAICSGLGLFRRGPVPLCAFAEERVDNKLPKRQIKAVFEAGRFSRSEVETIACLRLETVRKIMKALLESKQFSHRELAVQVNISTQGLTWQMNRLRETKLIQQNRNSISVTYTLGQTNIPLVVQAMTITESY